MYEVDQATLILLRAVSGNEGLSSFITKTRILNKYTENFTTKNRKISDKNSDSFHISVQNIDYGYSLEPPRRGFDAWWGCSNEYSQSMFEQK